MRRQNAKDGMPMNRRSLLALFAVTSMLGACTTMVDSFQTGGFSKMTGSEIRLALIGNSLDGTDADGDYVIHYNSPSTMRIDYRDRTESGVWRIKGDQYCRRWQTFGKGKERCVTFYRKGDQINWVHDGKITDRAVLISGNPAGL